MCASVSGCVCVCVCARACAYIYRISKTWKRSNISKTKHF